MNRLTRITAILIQLQSKRVVTAKEMAERFDVSLRTIYRDVKALQDAGVPIGSENGLGYFIIKGYHLPPISLTEEEANTLIVLEQFVGMQGDKSFSKHFHSLLYKIKSTLKYLQKKNIELLEERTEKFVQGEVYESNWLADIQKAITKQIVLDIAYHSLYKDEMTQRKIEPLAVYFTKNAWITVAYCQLRKEIREFRLDRIHRLVQTNHVFSIAHDFSLQNYFEGFRH